MAPNTQQQEGIYRVLAVRPDRGFSFTDSHASQRSRWSRSSLPWLTERETEAGSCWVTQLTGGRAEVRTPGRVFRVPTNLQNVNRKDSEKKQEKRK